MDNKKLNDELLPALEQAGVSCRSFVEFLVKNGYEVRKANPRHVPGQGYSPAPYYSDVDICSAVDRFLKNGS